MVLGNTTPSGTEGNSEGQITVCSDSQYVARLKAPSLTDDRAINFPDKGGTVALTSDIDGKVDTAGTGLTKNGTTISTYVPRVGQDVNTKPGQFRFNILEYNNASANIPTSHFYHILTSEGEDVAYAVQLALGMTIDRVFVRRCDANTWGSWNELAFKSDIRHWSSDSWVTQNSSYTFTDPELTQGSYLVSINGYDSYAQGLILAQRFYNGMTNIVELNTAPYFSVSFNSDNQLTVATDLAQGVIEGQKL